MSFLVLNLEDKGSRSKSTVLKEIGKYHWSIWDSDFILGHTEAPLRSGTI